MKYPDTRILIFCKAPVPGRVNSRLVPLLGEHGAARLHMEMARRIVRRCVASQLAPVQLWCHPDASHPFFGELLAAESLYVQTGSGLGERMALAFSRTLASADVSHAVLIGTDCPGIDATYLDTAMAKLESHDAVLGPAEDGGYGLIGLNHPDAELFAGISWGGDCVCADTCRRLNRRRANWALLAPVWDVDRPEDLARYRREC